MPRQDLSSVVRAQLDEHLSLLNAMESRNSLARAYQQAATISAEQPPTLGLRSRPRALQSRAPADRGLARLSTRVAESHRHQGPQHVAVVASHFSAGLQEDVAPLQQTSAGALGVDECAICLKKVSACTLLASLDCGHGFHKACIDNWLSRKPTCPCCRAVVASATLQGQGDTATAGSPERAQQILAIARAAAGRYQDRL